MARVTSKAGAAFLPEGGSGFPPGSNRVPAVIGGETGAKPAGVAMKLDPDSDGFHLVVLDAGNAALLSLGPFCEDEIVAEWRSLAASSGLIPKIQLSNGAVMTPYPQIGRVQVGASRIRRRHGLLSGRRPRFLTRRRTGRFPARPQVHREPEIAEGGDY